jgi:hypothetical protein
MDLLVTDYPVSIHNCINVNDFTRIKYILLEGTEIDDIICHIADSTGQEKIDVYALLEVISQVNNIYLVTDNEEYSDLKRLGFKICTLYKGNYIDIDNDIEFIKDMAESTTSINYDKALESAASQVESVKSAIDNILKFCEGELGLLELSLTDKINCRKARYVFTELVEYLTRLNNETHTGDRARTLIKMLSNNLNEANKESIIERGKAALLEKEVEDLNGTVERLNFDNELYKENAKLFLFPSTYVVKECKTKVLYVREYSHCNYLGSMLFNFRLFLADSNKNGSYLFVIGKHIYGLDETRIEKGNSTAVVKSVEDLSDLKDLEKLPIVNITEQNAGVWDNLLNRGLTSIIVLDRFKATNPILDLQGKKNLYLTAVSSSKDVSTFNLSQDKVISSVDKIGKYTIPYIEGYSGKRPSLQFNLYKDRMASIFRQWARQVS